METELTETNNLVNRENSVVASMPAGLKQPWIAQVFVLVGVLLFSFALFILKTLYKFSDQNNWESSYTAGLFGTIFAVMLMKSKKISAFDVPKPVRGRLAQSAISISIGVSFFLASLNQLTLGQTTLLLSIIPVMIRLLEPLFKVE